MDAFEDFGINLQLTLISNFLFPWDFGICGKGTLLPIIKIEFPSSILCWCRSFNEFLLAILHRGEEVKSILKPVGTAWSGLCVSLPSAELIDSIFGSLKLTAVIALTPQRLASGRGVSPRVSVLKQLPSHHWLLVLLTSSSWFEMARTANEHFIKDWERTASNRKLSKRARNCPASSST